MTVNHSIAGCFALCFASCSSLSHGQKIDSVAHVDLNRYMGAWHVIACMDNAIERDFVDAEETYALREDGKIAVHFQWREKSFRAPLKTHDFTGRIVDRKTNARWKMRLFPLFKVSYIITYLSPDYSLAAVSHPSRKFGWILARQKTIADEDYAALMKQFERQGYNVEKFIRVPQIPEASTHFPAH
jgi:apolipoprotein D and lipocalin family protein